MRIIISERQYNWLINEQKTKQDFEKFLDDYNTIKFENELNLDKLNLKSGTYTKDTFLDKLNSSPIKLNMFHITTDGYMIGTGSISAEKKLGKTNITLSTKPVGDFKTAMIILTKNI